jgi:hypothetical protein
VAALVLAFVATPGCRRLAPRRLGPDAEAHPASRFEAPAPPVPPTSTDRARPAEDAPPPQERAAPPTHVYAKTRYVWVRYQPYYTSGWTGFLWLGGSAKLRSPTPARMGGECAWYAIEPRGYVCVDEVGATLDPNDPVLRELTPYAPRLDSPTPHSYGESRETPRYHALPSADEQRRREGGSPAPRATRRASVERASGAPPAGAPEPPAPPPTEGPPLFSSLPPTLQHDRRRLPLHSTVAWSHEAVAGGRTWLLTADFTWVPKDRVAPYPPDPFRGVELGEGARLPLAFFRGRDRPKYRRRAPGAFEPTGASWPRLSHVGLTGASERDARGGHFLETSEEGLYVAAADAVVPEARAVTPWGAPVGAPDAGGRAAEGSPDASGRAPAGRGTWVDVSIEGGWLIAYEGTRPAYVTLVSPGRGGAPERGRPTLATASTPTGRFSINGKFATATMEAPNDFIHSDVPWSLTFTGPYAIHTAYWHDRWGEKMSAGCINVSAYDGRWLFQWAEPTLPEGWHGVRWEPAEGPATLLFVRP